MFRCLPPGLCLLLVACVLPDWPPPWVDDDTVIDDDTADDDDTTGDDDTTPVDDPWITIDGDEYLMGSDEGDADELPIHTVTVPSFQLMRTEVTVAHYVACIDAGACTVPTPDADNCTATVQDNAEQPIGCVDWDQAQDFCAWSGGRLPSESEWEFAARNRGADVVYPWGDEPATCDHAIMHDLDYGNGCGLATVWPVCSRSPAGDTDEELCDMAGNAAEWVQDWYHASYEGAPADGSAWESGGGGGRITRGGSSSNDAEKLRAVNRGYSSTDTRSPGLGIRCARTPR